MSSIARVVLALVSVAVMLAFSSCDTSRANGTVVRVDAEEAVRLLREGGRTIVDLRPPEAYAAGHVAGAVNIDASAPDFDDRVAVLDEDVVYLVYARTPELSAPVADTMVRAGVDRVIDAGGFGLLALAGAPLAR